MNIQKTSNTNFKARKILTTQRYFKSGNIPRTEEIELFELNQMKDTSFARRCYRVLSNIHTRELGPLQKQLKFFLKDFLENRLWGTKNYYLAIKNSETICGGISTTDYADTIHITQAFSEQPKNHNLESLFYGLLSTTKEKPDKLKFKQYNNIKTLDSEIPTDSVDSLKRKISTIHCGTIYDTQRENNMDLEEILDIKDFETNVL